MISLLLNQRQLIFKQKLHSGKSWPLDSNSFFTLKYLPEAVTCLFPPVVSYKQRRPDGSEGPGKHAGLIQTLSGDLTTNPTRGPPESWRARLQTLFILSDSRSPTSRWARESEQKAFWQFPKAFLPIRRATGGQMARGTWTRSPSRGDTEAG